MRPLSDISEIDLSQPSPARVYDVHLGGSHNFAVDREMAEYAAQLMPQLPTVLRANRSFLRRAVRHLVADGITQFLDLGSGIPTVGNVHEIAQHDNPECRIAYVDNDPIACAHSRDILRDNPLTSVLQADLHNPAAVLDSPEVTGLLDLSRPIAVLMVSVLHFVPDTDDPVGIVAGYVDSLVSGSCVAIAHACSDDITPETKRAAEVYKEKMGGFWMRTGEEIAAQFGDLTLLDPGLVNFNAWRPDEPEIPEGANALPGLAGVARKP